jgi:carboxylesterase type B
VTEGLSKRQPIYGYLFNTTGFMNGLKAHHGADLAYAMGPDAVLPLTEPQRKLAENMLQYFVKFIKTGNRQKT